MDINNFDAIEIGLASSKKIRSWSHGEVTKPETINYRTLKPEKDGLFCERIFGPTKDWECYCGKYKRVRYKGIICERCGVEVTRQKVRRERMGHIDLAAPVSHIWFFKGVPSRIGYLLDIAPRELEKVLYFAASIVTAVDVEARAKDLNDLEDKVKSESEQIYVDRDEALAALEQRLQRRRDFFAKGKDKGFDEDDDFWARGLANWAEEAGLPTLEEVRSLASGIFPELAGTVSTEDPKKLRDLVRATATRSDRKLVPREHEQVATAAQQMKEALAPLRAELEASSGSKKGALTKHVNRVVDALLTGTELEGDDAELVSGVDMKNLEKAREVGKGLLADVLAAADPSAPAEDVRELAYDLCLKEGARKDDLDTVGQWVLKVREMYADIESRREDAREAAVDAVRRLEETWTQFRELEPKKIINDEQIFRELKDRVGSPYGFGVYFRGGMGAESIRDLLRDLDLEEESRSLRETIKTSKGQKQQRAIKRLKVVSAFVTSENKPEWMILEAVPVIPPELRPMVQLDGGRFGQNLLGKRVDYSGRSVIVAGPYLKLHQCGLPKLMALELFKPFIMSRLVERKSVQNIKAAKKDVESMTPEVWDVLEEVIAEHPVLLTRAPTLHRLGIQAFEPVLVEGKAIQVHPLVCHAFNADFDGDQMAVHLPLSAEAQAEARVLMLSANNILSPAHGAPLATPTQDMILGTYYLTYGDDAEALAKVDPAKHEPRVQAFRLAQEAELAYEGKLVELHDVAHYRPEWLEGGHIATTVGRIIFNDKIERALEETLGDEFDLSRYQFINMTLKKRDVTAFLDQLVQDFGAPAISQVLDAFKDLGFKYATQAGITVSKNDVVVPPSKDEIIGGFEQRVAAIQEQYDEGLITEEE